MNDQTNALKPWLLWIAAALAIMGMVNLHNSQTFGRALSITDQGRALEAKGNLQGAIDKYDEALRLHPHSAYFLILLGNAYHKIGQNDKALASYETAIKMSPRHFWAHYQLGNLYRDEHRYKEAITEFNGLISMKDNWYGSNKAFHYTEYQNLAYGELGYCYARLGRRRESVEAYRQYLIINPTVEDRQSVQNFIGSY